MVNAAQLNSELRNFSGTETWFRHGLFRKYLYTEGIQFLAEKAECYWLLDKIFALQDDQPSVKAEEFQTWDLIVYQDKTAQLKCGNGNGHVVYSEIISFTTFPLSKIRFYMTDNILLLPTEY